MGLCKQNFYKKITNYAEQDYLNNKLQTAK